MIYQVGKKQCSNSGRKRNDIAPQESDFMVQPPSLREFPGPLTPPPPWNFQFPPWWGSGYFLEPHINDFHSKTDTSLVNIALSSGEPISATWKPQICFASGGFSPWTPNGALPLYPAPSGGYFLLFSCYLKSFWQPWLLIDLNDP